MSCGITRSPTPKAGYGITGGPLVANGKVMIGTTGRAPGGNFIVALDAQTGAEAWRFNTIAQPGRARRLQLERAAGRTSATARRCGCRASYDQTLNLAFFGPAQTYDTGPLRIPSDAEGITNDGLYTDSTLAINVTTGSWCGSSSTSPTISGTTTGPSSGRCCRCR